MLPYAAGSMTCGLDREFLEQPVGQISWAAAINRARLVLLAQCPLCPDSDQMLPRNEMTRCAISRRGTDRCTSCLARNDVQEVRQYGFRREVKRSFADPDGSHPFIKPFR